MHGPKAGAWSINFSYNFIPAIDIVGASQMLSETHGWLVLMGHPQAHAIMFLLAHSWHGSGARQGAKDG